MPVKIDSVVKNFIPEKFVPVKKEPLPQPKALDASSAAKNMKRSLPAIILNSS